MGDDDTPHWSTFVLVGMTLLVVPLFPPLIIPVIWWWMAKNKRE